MKITHKSHIQNLVYKLKQNNWINIKDNGSDVYFFPFFIEGYCYFMSLNISDNGILKYYVYENITRKLEDFIGYECNVINQEESEYLKHKLNIIDEFSDESSNFYVLCRSCVSGIKNFEPFYYRVFESENGSSLMLEESNKLLTFYHCKSFLVFSRLFFTMQNQIVKGADFKLKKDHLCKPAIVLREIGSFLKATKDIDFVVTGESSVNKLTGKKEETCRLFIEEDFITPSLIRDVIVTFSLKDNNIDLSTNLIPTPNNIFINVAV